jgi:hypothetical protein
MIHRISKSSSMTREAEDKAVAVPEGVDYWHFYRFYYGSSE